MRLVRRFGLVVSLMLAAGIGSGCRATRHVVQLSRLHEVPVAHRVQTLEAAFESPDGRLWLHTSGRLAGARKLTPITVVLPPAVHATGVIAQRIVVPANSLQPGQQPALADAVKWKRISVGLPLSFAPAETYDWDRLPSSTDNVREIRLVHRRGMMSEWELLHITTDAVTQSRSFTVFEVKPQQLQVRHPAALALVPLAVAADGVAVGTMIAGPVALVGATTLGGNIGAVALIDVLEPVKELRSR